MNIEPSIDNQAGQFNLSGTVLFNELSRKIAGSITAASAGDETVRYLIRTIRGGGKSHFLQLLKQELERTGGGANIVPLIFNHDYSTAYTEREICRAAARQSGFSGGGNSLESLVSLLKDNGEKAVLLLENPHQIFGESYHRLMDSIIRCGVSVVIVSDNPNDESAAEFRKFELPVFSIRDLAEMLKNHGNSNEISESAVELFNCFKFIPMTPKNADEAADACIIAGRKLSAAELFYRFLERRTAEYKYRYNTISPQQRSILMAVAESEELLPPAELADNTGISLPVINTQIKRLRDAGIIREVKRGGGRQSRHYPADPLFACWVKVKSQGRKIPFIELAVKWHDYRAMRDTPMNSFVRFLQDKILDKFTPEDDVRYLLDSSSFPAYPYEPLTKTFISYIRGGDLRRAEAAMEIDGERSIAVGKNQKAARAKLLTGIARLKMGKIEGAKTALKESSSRGENHASLAINLGTVFYREGNLINARNNFMLAVKSTDKFPAAFCGLGAVLRSGGDLNQAEEYFSRALKLNVDSVPALTGLANVNCMWKKHDLALKLLKDALELEKDNPICLKAAANISFAAQKFSQSWEWNRQLLKVLPGENSEKLYLAACLAEALAEAENNNYGLAENAFTRAVKFDFSYSTDVQQDILVMFFIALMSAGKFDFCAQAAEILEDETSGKPGGMLAYLMHFIGVLRKSAMPERILRMIPEERDFVEEMMESVKGRI